MQVRKRYKNNELINNNIIHLGPSSALMILGPSDLGHSPCVHNISVPRGRPNSAIKGAKMVDIKGLLWRVRAEIVVYEHWLKTEVL